MGSIVSDKILPPRQAKRGVSRRITYTADRTVPPGAWDRTLRRQRQEGGATR